MKDFEPARRLAESHGFRMTNPSDGCYQLRCGDWIYNLYPRESRGGRPRIYSDRAHFGPFLEVPEMWTFMDVVNAAIKAVNAEVAQ